jgi:uncharacterized protein (UPF0276 family)
MASSVSIGAFYNPHLALETLAAGDLIGHLAMADPPGQHDPAWPEIRARFTLLLHDYLGQLSEPLDEEELGRARLLLDQYRSPWAAEHLQRIRRTTSSVGNDARTLLDYVFPPLYTEDLLAEYARNARLLRDRLGVPLAVEPIPTYLHLDLPQMSEPEFLHRLCEQSGCHLLLDIVHTWLSARFAGLDPRSLLLQLPLERVIEIHVSGHAPDPDLEEPWIAPILPNSEILDLAELAAVRAPGLRAITFDAFSPSLRPETLMAGVRILRERFGQGA